ncbi:MAG TPA: flagellar basal body L-ring protein FlgH [Caulobacteraceae bacterium]|jgi:flagellar L-ring protein precursor FlgH
MNRGAILAAAMACAGVLGAPAAIAANLYTSQGNWADLAADRPATRVGDTITVVIDESSTASNSASNSATKSSHFGGSLATTGPSGNGALDLSSGFSGDGQTQRVHKMVAEISVTVDQVLPNGDLQVSGSQALKINGERTNIRLKGRLRPADIDNDNTVLSTRLADATIDYDGAGFIDKNVRPGILTRIFSWFGLP